jgi:glucose/arabinose dehydrogenase
MKFSTVFVFCLIFILELNAQVVSLEVFGSGFLNPVDIKNAGDTRLFVVEKAGVIKILNIDGTINGTNFLNITSRVGSSANEQGLLGMAFHPDYSFMTGGFFFVNYTNTSGDTVISKFTVATNSATADDTSEVILMTIDQPYGNHNGGDLLFGPDGFLYIGTGDGGSGGDPENRAQDGSSLLGKMLRIDVENGTPYAIPSDNPFVNDGTVLKLPSLVSIST